MQNVIRINFGPISTHQIQKNTGPLKSLTFLLQLKIFLDEILQDRPILIDHDVLNTNLSIVLCSKKNV